MLEAMAKPSSKKCRRTGCPIAFTLDVLGDRWTLLIIRDLTFMGKRYYGEFLDSGEGIATNVLADRLSRLESEGIVSKRVDPKDQKKYLYQLTNKGEDLLPVLLEVILWGATYDPKTAAPKAFIDRLKADRSAVIQETLAQLRAKKPKESK
ncbi:MAG: helix-turn-helix transcriptional regulator [Nitrospira sp.]|nr:helix-turn-helix transcriptional regulator [Nitrospira sp.]